MSKPNYSIEEVKIWSTKVSTLYFQLESLKRELNELHENHFLREVPDDEFEEQSAQLEKRIAEARDEMIVLDEQRKLFAYPL